MDITRWPAEPVADPPDIETPRLSGLPNRLTLELVQGCDMSYDLDIIREKPIHHGAGPLWINEYLSTFNLVFDSTIVNKAGDIEGSFLITDHDEPGRKWLHLYVDRNITARMIPGDYSYSIVARLAAPDEESPFGVDIAVVCHGTLEVKPSL